jgi:hypothetical protein
MLDPMSALSLASSVVQFVDFGIKLVSEGVELYEKGTLANNDEIEQITRDLTQLTEELTATPQVALDHARIVTKPPSRDELALQELACSCKLLGDQLLNILDGLKPQKSHNGLESFRKALRSARKKERSRILRNDCKNSTAS